MTIQTSETTVEMLDSRPTMQIGQYTNTHGDIQWATSRVRCPYCRCRLQHLVGTRRVAGRVVDVLEPPRARRQRVRVQPVPSDRAVVQCGRCANCFCVFKDQL